MSQVRFPLAFILGIFLQTFLLGTRFSHPSGTPDALSSMSYRRLTCPSPHHRELCPVEESVKGAGDQPRHGLRDRLLWVEQYRCE